MGSQFLINRRLVGALISAATILAAGTASAQATIRGTLYDDSTGKPMHGAVMLVDPATDAPVANTQADSTGQFSLRVASGVYALAAVREGYTSTLSAPIQLGDGDRMTVLLPIATTEAHHKISVVEHARSQARALAAAANGPMADFARRRAAGIGLHYDRADFAKTSIQSVGQFLETLPGVDVGDPNFASTVSLTRNAGLPMSNNLAGNFSSACKLGWYLDGRRMDMPGRNDPMTDGLSQLPLDNIEGIEVFRGLSEMPAEFADIDQRCGVIALWSVRQ